MLIRQYAVRLRKPSVRKPAYRHINKLTIYLSCYTICLNGCISSIFPGRECSVYTSFRALMAVLIALLISSIWGDKFINLLKKKQITETQRDAKIDPFGVNKVGVPSMGGVIIIVAILIPCLLLGKLHNI